MDGEMYAIIKSGGKQYWVTEGEKLEVNRLNGKKKGDKVELEALWAAEEGKDDSSTRKAKVTAEVTRQSRGPKIVVFKKRPKSRYSRKAGHRQEVTHIEIKKISLN